MWRLQNTETEVQASSPSKQFIQAIKFMFNLTVNLDMEGGVVGAYS